MREKSDDTRPKIVSGRSTASSPTIIPAASNRVAASSGRMPAASGRMTSASNRIPVASSISSPNSGSSPRKESVTSARIVPATSSSSTSARSKPFAQTNSTRIPVQPAEPQSSQSGRMCTSISARNSGRLNAVDTSDAKSNSQSSRLKASFFETHAKEVKIGGAVVAVVVLCVLVYAMSGSGKSKDSKNAAPTKGATHNESYTDSTPSSVWANRGKEKLAKGDRQGAMSDYNKAGEAAQREGDTTKASEYATYAYSIGKTTTMKDIR